MIEEAGSQINATATQADARIDSESIPTFYNVKAHAIISSFFPGLIRFYIIKHSVCFS